MAGLRKAKKFDWKDTNLALFGSDTEKNVSFSSKMAAVLRWYVYWVVDFRGSQHKMNLSIFFKIVQVAVAFVKLYANGWNLSPG